VESNGEFEGFWWLPEEEEVRLHGRLRRLRNGNWEFFVRGDNTAISKWKSEGRRDVIHGLDESGLRISVLDSILESYQPISGGLHRLRFFSRLIAVGVHTTAESEIMYEQYTVKYQHLHTWNDIKSEVSIPKKRISRDGVDGVTIDVTSPKPKAVTLSSGITIEFVSAYKYQISWSKRRFLAFEHRSFVRFRHPAKVSFAEALRHAGALRLLLTLGVGEYTNISSMFAGSSEEGDNRAVVFCHVDFHVDEEETKDITSTQVNFPLSAIEKTLDEHLEKLFQFYERFEAVINQFLATKSNPTIHLENEFLNMCQSLEAIHRLTCDGEVNTEDMHKKKIENICDSVSAKHRKWLMEKLKYSNEKSFRKRLLELVEKTWVVSESFLKDKKAFCNEVLQIRNRLVHRMSEASGFIQANFNEVLVTAWRMDLLVQILFLLELGFSEEQVLLFLKPQGTAYRTIRNIALNENKPAK